MDIKKGEIKKIESFEVNEDGKYLVIEKYYKNKDNEVIQLPTTRMLKEPTQKWRNENQKQDNKKEINSIKNELNKLSLKISDALENVMKHTNYKPDSEEKEIINRKALLRNRLQELE